MCQHFYYFDTKHVIEKTHLLNSFL